MAVTIYFLLAYSFTVGIMLNNDKISITVN
ncbi:hypothetical protein DSUL_50209 [Desulfovibrionales bacterium]